MATLSIGNCINYGWETFKKRPWFLIGALVLACLISAVPSLFGPHPHVGPDGELIEPPITAFHIIISIVSIVVSFLVAIGLTNFSIRAHDNVEGVQLSDLWYPKPFWSFAAAHIVAGIAIGIGFVLLIVPGVILMLGWSFVRYLIVERGLGPINALKESWRITKGHKWQLFLFGLALFGINLLGALAIGIGLLVSVPVTMIAVVHAYRTLAT